MAIKLNDAELDALRRCSSSACCVYVLGLRPRMDYATGLVGAKFPVSRRVLIADAGGTESMSEQQISRRLRELNRVGLAVQRSTENRQIQHLVLADFGGRSGRQATDRQPTGKSDSQTERPADTPLSTGSGLNPQENSRPDNAPTDNQTERPADTPVRGPKGGGADTNLVSVICNSGSSKPSGNPPRARVDQEPAGLGALVGAFASLDNLPNVCDCSAARLRESEQAMAMLYRCLHQGIAASELMSWLSEKARGLPEKGTYRPGYFLPMIGDRLESKRQGKPVPAPTRGDPDCNTSDNDAAAIVHQGGRRHAAVQLQPTTDADRQRRTQEDAEIYARAERLGIDGPMDDIVQLRLLVEKAEHSLALSRRSTNHLRRDGEHAAKHEGAPGGLVKMSVPTSLSGRDIRERSTLAQHSVDKVSKCETGEG